jgi:hypothetical protein
MSLISRRNVLVAGCATAGVSAAGAPQPKACPRLAHHALFWLKDPGSQQDLAMLVGLQSLGNIESVRRIHVGVPASTEGQPIAEPSYSASGLLFFDDRAGQSAYDEHPIHRKFLADCSHLWRRVVSYDTVMV